MGEILNRINDAQEYWKFGGRLEQEDYLDAVSILSRREEKPEKVRYSSFVQADSIARIVNLLITEEQRYLYAVLREKLFEEGKRVVSPEGTVPVWTLSDQGLMAEVFLLTGDIPNYESLKCRYPNIFGYAT